MRLGRSGFFNRITWSIVAVRHEVSVRAAHSPYHHIFATTMAQKFRIFLLVNDTYSNRFAEFYPKKMGFGKTHLIL
jgi:hypothetical protein